VCPVWLSELAGKDRFTIEQFCEGRKNKKAYNLFYTKFIPAVVGPELFRQRLKDATTVDLCTASDEAFTLLLLENSYARWVNIYELEGGIPSQRRGDTKRTFTSDIEAKYTRGGIKLSSDQVSQKQKGWTQDGIKRFNALFASVMKDRLRRPTFDAKFIKHVRERQTQPIQSKKRKYENVLAAHSLWDEDKPEEHASEHDDSDSNSSGGGTI